MVCILCLTKSSGPCAAFFLRFVDDYRYVGLFKRHKESRFARMDNWLSLPLCLGLAAALAAVLLLPRP